MKHGSGNIQYLLVYGFFVLLFGMFLHWTAPDIVPSANGGELTTAAVSLGIPHPTGYATWTILGHGAATFIPFGNLAFRINLFTMCLTFVALCLTWLLFIILRPKQGKYFCLPGIALLAIEPFVWREAIAAEVYGFHLLLTVLLITVIAIGYQRNDSRYTLLACFIWSISLTNHLLSLFNTPLLLLPLLQLCRGKRAPWRRLIPPLALIPLGFSPVIYLWIRRTAQPALAWRSGSGLQGFIDHLTGAQFHGHLTIPGQTTGFFSTVLAVSTSISPLMRVLAIPGFVGLICIVARFRKKPEIWGIVPFFLGVFIFPLTYAIHDIGSYLLVPIWLLFLGAIYLFRSPLKLLQKIPPIATLVAAGVLFVGFICARADISTWHQPITRIYGQGILNGVKPGFRLEYQGDNPMNALSYLLVCEKYTKTIPCYDLTGNLAPIPSNLDPATRSTPAAQTYRPVTLVNSLTSSGFVYHPCNREHSNDYFIDLSQVILQRYGNQQSDWNPNFNELLAQMFINLSDYCFESAKPGMGMQLSEKAIELPTEASLKRYIASMSASRGNFTRAISINKYLVEKDPSDGSSANNLAYYYFLNGTELEIAREYARQARQLQPDNLSFFETEYQLLLVMGQLDLMDQQEEEFTGQVPSALRVQRRLLETLSSTVTIDIRQSDCLSLSLEWLRQIPRPALNHHYRLSLQRKLRECSSDPETWQALVEVCEFMDLPQVVAAMQREELDKKTDCSEY